ncbi:phage head closure protein [Bacillus altitudinis]|uniref:phage head closure protein n=1 Tax=Bacillus altitudinis TaxID=293387 RepID=UPI003F719A17
MVSYVFEEFPHEITFQKLEKVLDGGGGYTELYVDHLTIPARVTSVSSREFYQAQQLQYPVDHNVYFEYREDIDNNMRIKYENKILTLKSSPIDQGGEHEIMCLKCQVSEVLNG